MVNSLVNRMANDLVNCLGIGMTNNSAHDLVMISVIDSNKSFGEQFGTQSSK